MVVDASVWVSRLVPQDANHIASREWFTRQIAGGGLLIAPALLLAEVAAAISRRTGAPALAHQAVRDMQRLPMLRLVSVDQRLARQAAKLAADLGLRGADAVYVAAAQQLKVALITWDKEQQERAATRIVVQAPSSEPSPN